MHTKAYLERRTKDKSKKEQKGVALITALLLLMLLTGLSVAMVISVRSDLLINGNYRNFRGSFYAADSGVNIARAELMNQVTAVVPGTLTPNTQPIAAGTESNVVNYINNTYGQSYKQLTGTGSTANSWPESFKIDSTQTSLTLVSCTVSGPSSGGTCAAPTGNPSNYQYVYAYTLSALGQAQGSQQAISTDRGQLTVNVNVTPHTSTPTYKTSFAAYGTFIDKYSPCSAPFTPGTLTGPFFTNGAWNFGTGGSYIFTDPVGQANADASYIFPVSNNKGNMNNGADQCNNVAGPSDKFGSTTIAPSFQNGFNVNQNSVPLPTDSFSQERAVLDGQGTNTNPITKQDLNSALKDITKTPYPQNGANSGVYLPYTTTDANGNPLPMPQLKGGGIFVEGDATVTLSPALNGSGQVIPGQVYTIVNNGVTTTITITPGSQAGAGTTVINNGSQSLTLSGVPAVEDPSGNPTNNGTMLYVDGNITSLSGPGEGTTAVNDGTAMTITAAGNVTITGDIRYNPNHEPVTTTQNQTGQGVPADTLIPQNNLGQVLGIFTASGDIQMNNQQSDGNLWIDASIAMISQNGTGGWVNVGPHINTLTLLGGRIANQAKAGNTTTRNIFFDRRFSSGGFAPPWYPSTTITSNQTVTADSTTVNATFQRVQWLYQSGYN